MPRNQVVFLDKIYKTQREFEEYVKKLLYDEIGVCLDVKNTHPDKYIILIQILKRHPEFDLKSKNMCNIKIINDVLNVKALKTIIITNREEIDISWRCAITGKHKPFKGEIMSAMRSSIDEQIYNFKTNCKNNYCELCNSIKELQVDHNDTKNAAFDELVYKFIKENNDIKIPENFGELNDGTHRRCFLEKDYIFRNKWVEYHRQNAVLRMLCHKCNITRPKTKKKLVL